MRALSSCCMAHLACKASKQVDGGLATAECDKQLHT
jgi:hypothetical protein